MNRNYFTQVNIISTRIAIGSFFKVFHKIKQFLGQSETVIGSHAMVATGIKEENGIKYIQLKNSYADNPNEQGKVHF